MRPGLVLSLALAFALPISISNAQEIVLEAVEAEAAIEEGEEEVVLVEEANVDELVVAEEGIVEQAVEGFINLIGNGFGAPVRGKPAKEAYTKNVDDIKTKAELNKLEKELAKDPNLQGMMPQYKLQFKCQCDAELRLLHLICNLTRSEFAKIEKDAMLTSHRALLHVCQKQAQMMNGLAGRNADQKHVSPNERMEKTLLQSVQRELGDERTKKYKAELDARRDFRKQGIVEMLTTSIDTLLILSEEQRPQVEKIFRDNWKPEWFNCAQYLTNSGIQYVSGIPKEDVRDLLTIEQKAVLDSIRWQPQNGFQYYFNGFDMFGFGHNQQGNLKNELKFAPEPKDAAEGKIE